MKNKIDITNNKWELVYSRPADKLFFSEKIPSNSVPKSVRENIVIYQGNGELNGVIFENFLRAFSTQNEYKAIISYVNSHTDKIIYIPSKLLTESPVAKNISQWI